MHQRGEIIGLRKRRRRLLWLRKCKGWGSYQGIRGVMLVVWWDRKLSVLRWHYLLTHSLGRHRQSPHRWSTTKTMSRMPWMPRMAGMTRMTPLRKSWLWWKPWLVRMWKVLALLSLLREWLARSHRWVDSSLLVYRGWYTDWSWRRIRESSLHLRVWRWMWLQLRLVRRWNT